MSMNYNKKITNFFRNPGQSYISMTNADLNNFFSNGYAKLVQDRCLKAYNIYDLKRGILEANYLARTDEQRYMVDLLMFALADIEHLQQTVSDLEQIISDLERIKITENQDDTKKENNKNEEN